MENRHGLFPVWSFSSPLVFEGTDSTLPLSLLPWQQLRGSRFQSLHLCCFALLLSIFTAAMGVLVRTLSTRIRSVGPSSIRMAAAEWDRWRSEGRVADDFEDNATTDIVELYQLFEPERLVSECLFCGDAAVQFAIKENLANPSALINYEYDDQDDRRPRHPEYIIRDPKLDSPENSELEPSNEVCSVSFTFRSDSSESSRGYFVTC